ncbi:terpenoid cyclases/Protein prenyltransferase [Viridothelium virens]|uniref:Protein farnesyltransferase subunit beta n=1 Tax=Viridothelium virens TaxID=1048519 RepID=A0A6A6H7R8_VIRVR|nr:terpenoid cyclases/Protein prenyltransferase [Viridothelium virens]
MSPTAPNYRRHNDSADASFEIELIRELAVDQTKAAFAVPALFTNPPPIQDGLETQTSKARSDTMQKCLPFLLNDDTSDSPIPKQNSFGIPSLRKKDHVNFLHGNLADFPAPFVAMDASRPWLFYWSLAGLSFLGEDVSEYRERLVQTVKPLQNATGGFGGGHGQLSHIASSYACVLSLAIVGGKEALELVDRKAMWQWLGSVKQRDGGFQVTHGGEEDMRGAYCAMTIISLLNLPLALPSGSPARVKGDETFLTGLMGWISHCQSFEGGIGAAPGNEAHGGYAFCALACLCIIGEPHETINRCLDVPLLLSWLSAQQTTPEGGFAGRTNKLVDACYSHWIGGCWALLEAAMRGANQSSSECLPPGSLWSREGLTRYLLCCCQAKSGGLRDKPGARPDAYHTCYSLAGLNAAQNHYYYSPDTKGNPAPLSASFNWRVDATKEEGVPFDEDDRIRLVHPVYVLPWGTAEQTRDFFKDKDVD